MTIVLITDQQGLIDLAKTQFSESPHRISVFRNTADFHDAMGAPDSLGRLSMVFMSDFSVRDQTAGENGGFRLDGVELAKAMRRQDPGLPILVACDNDYASLALNAAGIKTVGFRHDAPQQPLGHSVDLRVWAEFNARRVEPRIVRAAFSLAS